MVFDPIHSLPPLTRKINALDQAAPLAQWDFPEEFGHATPPDGSAHAENGRRAYVQVLHLLESFDMEELHAAAPQAVKMRALGFDAVKHLVLCQVEKRPPKLDLDVYPYPPRARVETTSAASYSLTIEFWFWGQAITS